MKKILSIFLIFLQFALLFSLKKSILPNRKTLPDNLKIESLKSIDTFNDEMFNQLSNSDKNEFFSSISIYSILYTLMLASDGKTSEEIQNILQIAPNDKDFDMSQIFNTIDNIQNEIFYNNKLQLKDEFTTQLDNLKYIKNAEEPKSHKMTDSDNMIPSFWKDLPRNTEFVLQNKLSFEQEWFTPFYEGNTKDDEFYVKQNSKIKTKFMNSKRSIHYQETSDFQIIELSYKNQRYSMIIYLPKEYDFDFSKINISSLTKDFHNQSKWTLTDFYIPKFSADTKYNLIPIMENLGIRQAFTPYKADFSKGFQNSKNLYIFLMIHNAKITVDEKKTEAKAVTATASARSSIDDDYEPPKPIIFNANHPFCYTIYDNDLGINLFSGIVRNPQE